MIIINNKQYDTSILEVVQLLRASLQDEGISMLNGVRDTPDNVMISCPYHKNGQEKRPSAGIKKTDGTFHCFACGEVHTLTEVISACYGKNDFGLFGENWLKHNFILETNRDDVSLDMSRSRPIDTKEYVTEEELDTYRYIHPYWMKRKITDPVLIDLFDLGYDKKTRCITFPVRDIKGNCVFVARRSVDTKFFNYPSGVEKPVYGLYEFYKVYGRNTAFCTVDGCNEVIICESMLDALTCWQYGKVAVALNGLGNELQFKQLNEMPCRKFILATDNDDAGMRARTRIRKNLKGKIVTEYILPNGRKDINELTEDEFDRLKERYM